MCYLPSPLHAPQIYVMNLNVISVLTPNMLQMFVLGGMNRGLYIRAFIACFRLLDDTRCVYYFPLAVSILITLSSYLRRC